MDIRREDPVELKNRGPMHLTSEPTEAHFICNNGPYFSVGATLEKKESSKNKTINLN